MHNQEQPHEIQYESTGWGSLSEARNQSGEWLDFKQGQGDSAVLRIVEVIGTRTKQFRNSKPRKVLEMSIEVFSHNSEEYNPPRMMRTNPNAAWCNEIRKEAESVAVTAGWDETPQTFHEYADEISNYWLRITRNDSTQTNRGHLDVENLGHVNGTKQLDTVDTTDRHLDLINRSINPTELRKAFGEAWTSTKDEDKRNTYKSAYDNRSKILSDLENDVPF